jgi:hypothetical protein
VYVYRHHDARSLITELYPVYCLSGLCLFSVATATASLLMKTSRQTQAAASLALVVYLFPRTIIDLVLCFSYTLADRSLRTDFARRQCRCLRQRDTLLYFTCTPRTYHFHSRICLRFVPSLFPIHSWELDTTKILCRVYLLSSALELGHVYFGQVVVTTKLPINDRFVALHPVCGGFQLCLFSVVTTTAPMETFEHCTNLGS